jgi:ubiquinone/menaquinone biosynthesis C-methylase UbiE
LASQDKLKELEFFRRHAEDDVYDVFFPESNARIVDCFEAACRPEPGQLIVDLGCGAGVFTELMRQRGHRVFGLDLCFDLLRAGRARWPETGFVTGDVERLPFADASIDAVMLSGIVHHLPDPTKCAAETARILKPGGRFFAFDPNRRNPFMYLYRDKSSPLYSSKGVTENERPVVAAEIAGVFRAAGLEVETGYLSGLKYRYVASSLTRWLLPAYNAIDDLMFSPGMLRAFRAFVLTSGRKP